jgi:hypothetical protein
VRVRRLGAVLVAALANGVVWLVADAAGVDFAVEPPGQGAIRVDLVAAIVVTLLTGIVAWGLLALLERVTRRGYAIWFVIAVLVFLVFLIPPISSDATTGTTAALLTMHTVEAVVLAVGFRTARR